MDISILISTYRRSELLTQTLDSFCTLDVSGLTWEIFVVDNAGDKITKETVERFYNKIPVKYFVETKKGKNNALNYALPLAMGESFVFTDDDIIADKNWLKEIWEGVRRWPDYFIFGGKVLPKWPYEHKINHPFWVSAYAIADWDLREGLLDKAIKVFGPNMAINRKLFELGWKFNPFIGPSGENYIVGSESELLIRLEQQGLKAIYLPKSIVFHQIRPEQMENKWIYKRAFRHGRARAYYDKNAAVVKIFGIPRYLIRQFLEIIIKRIFLFPKRDKFKKLDLAIKYWNMKGEIYQYRLKTW